MKYALLAVGVLGLGAMGLMAFLNRGDPDCLKMLPSEVRVGLGFDPRQKGGSFDVTGKTINKGAQNQMQATGFLECLRIKMGIEVVNKNEATIGPSSLGQVVNQWMDGTAAFRVHLLTATPGHLLQNMAIGPAAGHKHDIMDKWCRENAGCVICKPALPNEQTTQVGVELRENAPLTRRELPTKGVVNAAVPPLDYEDIADGKRYLQHCTPGAAPAVSAVAASAPASAASR